MWRDVSLSPTVVDGFAGQKLELANVWLSSAPRKESGLHFDAKENLLLQVAGKKVVKLFSIADSLYLYPRPMKFDRSVAKEDVREGAQETGEDVREGVQETGHEQEQEQGGQETGHEQEQEQGDQEELFVSNFSPVDPYQPDLANFPLFRKARPVTCELNAGDALYMPPFTWHRVSSHWDHRQQLNVAVNFWFSPNQQLIDEMCELMRSVDAVPHGDCGF
jgi:hypothetical protein